MKWWKRFWFKIIYMTVFRQVVKELKARGISPLSVKEDQIIIFLLSVKESHRSIVSLIVRLRNRSVLMECLAALGINEVDLTTEDLDWIEGIIENSGISVDDAVKEIRDARSHNRKLKDPKLLG